MSVLRATKIRKAFGAICVLAGIDFEIHEGESIAICGRSGEGKTTLLHILGRLEKPDGGEIEVASDKRFGFVFQSYNLLEDFTAAENVLMPDRIARKRANPEKAIALLKQVGLEDRAHLKAKFLSGGERQRVAIARALCNDPHLILADEPTGNLDRGHAKSVGNMLIVLVKEQKKSLILVTHDPELASLCDKQYHLVNGRVCDEDIDRRNRIRRPCDGRVPC